MGLIRWPWALLWPSAADSRRHLSKSSGFVYFEYFAVPPRPRREPSVRLPHVQQNFTFRPEKSQMRTLFSRCCGLERPRSVFEAARISGRVRLAFGVKIGLISYET